MTKGSNKDMWTVCWVENGKDKWERLEFSSDVVDLLDELVDNDICIDSVLIFAPDSDVSAEYVRGLGVEF